MSFNPTTFRAQARNVNHWRGEPKSISGRQWRGQIGTPIYRALGVARRFSVLGVSRDSAGALLAGATVKGFRVVDRAFLGSTTSDEAGNYTLFDIGPGPFMIVAYKAGSPDIVGVTKNNVYSEPRQEAAPQTFFDFSIDVDPLGAPWVQGKDTGIDWENMKSIGGNAVGAHIADGPGYDDPIACLTGYPAAQFIEGVLFVDVGYVAPFSQEVELHLHCTITANSITTYEFLVNPTTGTYQHVRWDGGVSNIFTGMTITNHNGGFTPAVDGDVFRYETNGAGNFSVFQNGTLKATFTDTTYLNGGPGIAAFWTNAANNGDRMGWKSITVGSL